MSQILKSEAGRQLELAGGKRRASARKTSVHTEREHRTDTLTGFSLFNCFYFHFDKKTETQFVSCLELVEQRAAMELSSIGDQVFAVESITKKRVRKVRRTTNDTLHITYITYSLFFFISVEPHTQCSFHCPHAYKKTRLRSFPVVYAEDMLKVVRALD